MGISLSCYASHQTIAENDKCRVIPIMQFAAYHTETARFRDATSELYPARVSWGPHQIGWQSIGEFLAGTAMEYGRMKLARTHDTRRKFLTLLQHLVSHTPVLDARDSGSQKEFDLAGFVKAESEPLYAMLSARFSEPFVVGGEHDDAIAKIWAYIWEALVHHRLFVVDIRGRLRTLEFAIIHEDAYKTLVARQLSTGRRNGLPSDISAAVTKALELARDETKELRVEGLPDSARHFHEASNFADRLTELSDATRWLHLLRDHLTAVACAAYGGKISAEEAVVLLQGSVEDVYVLAAADNLGIGFSPVAFAADEDYDNHNGRAYVDFVSTVANQVDRSRKVALHGEFKTFELLAQSEADLEQLSALSEEWDCGFEIDRVMPVPHGNATLIKATLSVTMNLERMGWFLDEANLPFMRESVRQIS